MNREHELARREVWIRAWTSTARASNCTSTKAATNWADSALEAFDVRFKPLPPEPYRLKVRRRP